MNRELHVLTHKSFLECSASIIGGMIRNFILQAADDDNRRKITRIRKRKHSEMIESLNSHSSAEDERTALEKEHEEVIYIDNI